MTTASTERPFDHLLFLLNLVCSCPCCSCPTTTDLLNFDLERLSSGFLISGVFHLSSVCSAVVSSTLATQGSDASAHPAGDAGGPVIPTSSDDLQRSPDEDDDKLPIDVEQDGPAVDPGRTWTRSVILVRVPLLTRVF